MPQTDYATGASHALIIATDRYADQGLGDLRSPSRDAEEFAQVLADPKVGGFAVRSMVNEPGDMIREEIEGFFADRHQRDLLVLYLSCHGVKDAAGRLYFTATTTKLNRLAASGVSSDFIYEQADRCRAGKVLLLLDCCYSGAYLKGHRARAGERAGLTQLNGRGRAVITSSTALEYSFELNTDGVGSPAVPSVFTAVLVEGLRTGKADRDGDGLISVDDLYGYVYDRVREVTPYQTPEKKWGDVRGDFVIAKNPYAPAPVERELLPKDITEALRSSSSRVREVAIRRLAALAFGTRQGLALTAREVLQALADDDSAEISTAAMAALAEQSPLDEIPEPPKSVNRDHLGMKPTVPAMANKDSTHLTYERRESVKDSVLIVPADENHAQRAPAIAAGLSLRISTSEGHTVGGELCRDEENSPRPDAINVVNSLNRHKRFGIQRKWLSVSIIVLGVLIASSAPIAVRIYEGKYANYSGVGSGDITVRILPNDTARSLAARLVSLGVVETVNPFIAAVGSHASVILHPGYYRLRKHMKASLAYRALVDPRSRVRVVVVPGGFRLSKVPRILAGQTETPASAFIGALKHASELGLPAYAHDDPEGYLSPGTYYVQSGTSALRVLQAMSARFKQVSGGTKLAEGAKVMGLSEQKVVIVASLIQAERTSPKYYSDIARVIYNRLKEHAHLDLYSTVLYAKREGSLPLTYGQLQFDSPYNTFLHQGLPPGPISAPGRAALEAALHPANGNWRYFVIENSKAGLAKFTSSSSVFAQLEGRLGGGVLDLSCQTTGYLSSRPGYIISAEVGSGAAYIGAITVSFSDGNQSHLFSGVTVNADVTVINSQPWSVSGTVPSNDIGASTQPNSCTASATG